MKLTRKLAIYAFAFLVLSASAYAQTPREQLSQMVQQLQKTPGDNVLREKIIKLAPTMKPSPAVPDSAVAFEGRAQFAFKSAKSEGDYLAAAQEYEKAVAVAPWVPGYYADLCTIYEKAGRYEDAKRHCGFYLLSLTHPAEITNVKRRIAGLEFGIEKANSENSPPGKRFQAASAAASDARFVGRWNRTVYDVQGKPVYQLLVITREEKELRFASAGSMHAGIFRDPTPWRVPESRIEGDSLVFVYHQHSIGYAVCARFRAKGTLSEAGKLTIRYSLIPFTEPQVDVCPYQSGFGDYQEEWTR